MPKKSFGSFFNNVLFVLMALIIVIMFTQVLFRYIFNQSLSWSEELSKFIFVWMIFIGAAVCIKEKTHLGVEFLLEYLSDKWKRWLDLFEIILIILFNIVMSVTGFFWVYEVSGTLSPAMSLPLNWIFYAALPCAAVLSVIFGIILLKDKLSKSK